MRAPPSSGPCRGLSRWSALALLALCALLTAWAWASLRGGADDDATTTADAVDPAAPGAAGASPASESVSAAATTLTPDAATAAQRQRGAYLALAGNCAGCHTARGGLPYAGGRAMATPFGTVYAGNLTPDPATGLGRWTAADFWRALHHGRSRDGRLLVPVFPYPQYTQVTRADADALWAWLRTLQPAVQPQRAHELRFPYGTQAALAVWRALSFRPAVYAPDARQSAEWNRGAYLVRGLGHCGACHAGRNPLGASRDEQALGGGAIPMQGWYAPSLASAHEAGVADWSADEVVALLRTGASPRGSVLGPMAEVVLRSTQHLAYADLRAMAVYLQSLPQPGGQGNGHGSRQSGVEPAPSSPLLARGAALYDRHCRDCHGAQGEGATGAYPPLAGNRTLTMAATANAIRVVLGGGFPPATAGNPRPYGMPPFAQDLDDEDIAAVVSYARQRFGAAAGAVSPLDVQRLR